MFLLLSLLRVNVIKVNEVNDCSGIPPYFVQILLDAFQAILISEDLNNVMIESESFNYEISLFIKGLVVEPFFDVVVISLNDASPDDVLHGPFYLFL